MFESLKFYGKLSLMSIREEFSSLSATLAGLILYPCFIWIFSKLWLGLNNDYSSLGHNHLFAYIGLTEILFMTVLREPLIDKACNDFSLSFVRPRSWFACTYLSIFSRTIFRRLVYLLIFILIIPIYIGEVGFVINSAFRFLLLLPLITFLDSFYSFIITCSQVRFFVVRNMRMLIGKLFLIFGGVLAPLSDLPEPWNKFFLNLPFSDFIFQPCYFAIQNEFYQMLPWQWLARISIQCLCLILVSVFVYNNSRQYYHNFGG
jgi:hypothetical protein